MCILCDLETKVIGEILPGLYLDKVGKESSDEPTIKMGDYIICADSFIHCHLPSTIRPDPFDKMTDEEIEKASKEEWNKFEKWVEDANQFGETFLLDPMTGYELVKKAIEVGYSEESGYFHQWLFNRAGLLTSQKRED